MIERRGDYIGSPLRSEPWIFLGGRFCSHWATTLGRPYARSLGFSVVVSFARFGRPDWVALTLGALDFLGRLVLLALGDQIGSPVHGNWLELIVSRERMNWIFLGF